MSAVEILAYAVANGLSAADFSKLSLGFIIDFCIINNKLKNKEDIHREEKNFNSMKSVMPVVIEEYQNGEITEERYLEFMNKYNRLEGLYGFEYN